MCKKTEMLLDEDIRKTYLGNLNTVEFDLKLPKEGKNGSKIEWSSDNELFLKSDGSVVRPMNGIGDRKVHLHAVFQLAGMRKEKIYEVHILEEESKVTIEEVLPIERSVQKGKEIQLPLAVVLRTDTGRFVSCNVEWEGGNIRKFEKCGTQHIKGRIKYENVQAELLVHVYENYTEEHMNTKPFVLCMDQGETKLLQESAIERAFDRGMNYLKSVDDDQMLYNFRVASGLDTKKAEPMAGWDSPECLLRGHTTGHYLSALALAYRETKDVQIDKKIIYMVEELAKCQNAFMTMPGFKQGYIGAYSEEQFDLLEKGILYPDVWAPYYTLHKIIAGLLDIYNYTNNEKALLIAEKAGIWIYNRLSRLTKKQRETMWDTYIAGEFGGMNETLTKLYVITGNSTFLSTARMFDNDKLFVPMEEKKDVLEAMHVNQHIPQIIGCMEIFKVTGEKRYYDIAKFFWKIVVKSHIYVNGGVGEGEMFFEPHLSEKYITEETTEYCASYNMLKLTKELFQYEPNSYYMDYYERTMMNHIAAGVFHDTTGDISYFYSLIPGAEKDIKFENACCHGTGMESQMKYTEAIYAKRKDELYVNLFLNSETYWKEKDLYITQSVKEENPGIIRLKLKGERACRIKIRCPHWCNGTYTVLVNNGKRIAKCGGDGYIIIDRKSADHEIEIQFLCKLQEEYIEHNSDIRALTYGPYVLAALSNQNTYLEYSNIKCSIKRNEGNGLKFMTDDGILWVPLLDINKEKHHVYWKKYKSKG